MDGYISEGIITNIINSQDIVEVISRFISLKKTGQNYKGLCPFHGEKTPSFVVSPTKQLFHCFGCGTGGNVITFLIKQENTSFGEVVRKLGQDAGIITEYVTKENKKENTLYEINKLAACIYHENLINTKEAEPARNYLIKRGLTTDIIKKFNIGYSIDSWNSVHDSLRKKGCTDDMQLSSGIIIPQNKGNGYYDRFRKRIMFPIYDMQKRVVGFGGRVIDNSTPKYLNSPETPIFIKGNLLFGLDIAQEKIKQTGYAIIVEGYMDVIAAHQAGIPNVVGTLGTAFTQHHLRMLQRFCKEVILTFDADLAGINAALRTLDIFIGSDVRAKVMLLPEGEDPDTFIRKNSKTGFEELLKNSKGIIDFSIDRIINRSKNLKGVISSETKIKNAEDCLNIIRKVPNRIEQDFYLDRISKELNIEKDVMYAELKRKNKGRKETLPEKIKKDSERGKGVEETLLALLIKDKSLRELAKANLDIKDFANIKYQKTADYILNSGKEMNEILSSETEEDILSEITKIALSDFHFDLPEKNLLDCIKVLQRERLNIEIKEIEQDISKAELIGTFENVRSLLITKQRLLQKKKFLYEN